MKNGMACPKCGGRKSKVEYVRRHGDAVRRVRNCATCNRRFVTVEKPAGAR